MNNVFGIDTNQEDGPIHWKDYKFDFAFFRVTEGKDLDVLFREQWREAKGRTIRGPLHVFRPLIDYKEAARFLADTLDGDMGELPLAVRLNKTDGRPDVLPRLAQFISEYTTITKMRTVIIYATLDFLNLVQAEKFPYLGTFPLWLISYPFDTHHDVISRDGKIKDVITGKLMLAFPPPPRPFARVTFWRWTGKAKSEWIPGIPDDRKRDVNVSLFHGNHLQDLFAEFNITMAKADGEEQEIFYGYTPHETIIRNGPYDSYAEIGRLPAGTLIEGNDMAKDPIHRPWIHIIKAENTQGGPILLNNKKQVTTMPSWILASEVTERTKQEKKIKEVIIRFEDESETKIP